MDKRRKVYRSEKDRLIAGVCGGLSEYFNTSTVLVRFIFVLAAFAGGLGFIAYIVLWILAPKASHPELLPKDTIKENINEMKDMATESGQKFKEYIDEHKDDYTHDKKSEGDEEKL